MFVIVCKLNCKSIVKILFNMDVDINLCEKYGFGFFYIVSWEGYINIVNLLLINNVDINVCVKFKCSFFYVVCRNNYINIV